MAGALLVIGMRVNNPLSGVVVALGFVLPYCVEASFGVIVEALVVGVSVSVGVLSDAYVNVLAAVTIALKAPMPMPQGEFSARVPFGCWCLAVFNCERGLQVRIPSYHVRRSFVLPALPQFLNQEPPRPQQLALPDFSMVPHLAHANLLVVVVAVGVHM